MIKKNCHILLFIDNCPAHPKDVVLQNIEVVFLPPNSTSKLQPLDQGIIKVTKQYYRRRLVLRFIHDIDHPEQKKPITILDAMRYITSAWEAVSTDTIVNCFQNAGVQWERNLEGPVPPVEEDHSE